MRYVVGVGIGMGFFGAVGLLLCYLGGYIRDWLHLAPELVTGIRPVLGLSGACLWIISGSVMFMGGIQRASRGITGGMVHLVLVPSLFGMGYVGPFVTETVESGLRGTQVAVPQLIMAVTTFLFGVLLYFFRCRNLDLYGKFEVLVGVAGAVYITNQVIGEMSDSISFVFAEAASLYVIVRGMDNIHKGMSDDHHRETWERLFFGNKAI